MTIHIVKEAAWTEYTLKNEKELFLGGIWVLEMDFTA